MSGVVFFFFIFLVLVSKQHSVFERDEMEKKEEMKKSEKENVDLDVESLITGCPRKYINYGPNVIYRVPGQKNWDMSVLSPKDLFEYMIVTDPNTEFEQLVTRVRIGPYWQIKQPDEIEVARASDVLDDIEGDTEEDEDWFPPPEQTMDDSWLCEQYEEDGILSQICPQTPPHTYIAPTSPSDIKSTYHVPPCRSRLPKRAVHFDADDEKEVRSDEEFFTTPTHTRVPSNWRYRTKERILKYSDQKRIKVQRT